MNTVHLKRYVVWILYLLAGAFTGAATAQQALWMGQSLDGRACSSFGLKIGSNPLDYRIRKDRLPIVEQYHFTPEVENLVRGNNNVGPMGDLNYTLTMFPNHHRALYSIVRFSLGESRFSTPDSEHRAECYLQRAIGFAPDDPAPYLLFGLYLHRLRQFDPSIEMYLRAEELSPNDANLLYNMGLVYFDIDDFEKSRQYAERAYELGIEFPALRRKLQDVGYWN